MKKIIVVTAIFVAFGLVTSVSAETITGFFYASGPNRPSYVAQGSDTVTPEKGWTFLKPKKDHEDFNAIRLGMFSKSDPANYKWWNICLQMPEDQRLKKGNYVGHRFPFQGKNYAGFDWSGNGRGSNTSTSYFDILEVQYSPDGKEIVAIAVDFVQFEETCNKGDVDTAVDRWAHGSFRYNSSIPIHTKDILSE